MSKTYNRKGVRFNMGKSKISYIGQIAVNVKDVGRAVKFYRDVVGLPLLFESNGLAFMQCGETRLLLSLPEREEFNHPCSVMYFKVDDLYETVKTMKELGAHFIDEPHMVGKMGNVEIWMTFFNDTEGNTQAIMSEIE